jgi:chemotaxis family two-component system sensor kinase Cph1
MTSEQDCDNEQIQFTGKIQPVGSLIAFDSAGIIRYAALQPRLGDSERWLGKRAQDLLQSNYRRLIDAAAGRAEPTMPQLCKFDGGRWMSAVVHRDRELTIVELEDTPSGDATLSPVLFVSEKKASFGSYLPHIADNILRWSGFGRVMIYRFAQDWHGEVIAESLVEGMDSYLHHHFPATDIPRPARELFTTNWVRAIADVNATNIQILSTPDVSQDLDLTRSALRSAAEVHLEYLRNMNVGASLTLSIVCNGRLWGLIACHHREPKRLTADERSICSLLAKLVSSRVSSYEVNSVVDLADRVTAFAQNINSAPPDSVLECLASNKQELAGLVAADGFNFVGNEESFGVADALTPVQVERIISTLERAGLDRVNSSDLKSDYPELADLSPSCAGILAARVENNWVIWKKREVVQTYTWAGNPHSKKAQSESVETINPRKSFSDWRERVYGTSLPWHQFEIEAIDRLIPVLESKLKGRSRPSPRVDAKGYLDVIRASIAHQVADLKEKLSEVERDSFRSGDSI